MITNLSTAVVYGTDPNSGDTGIGLLVIIGLGVITFIVASSVFRGSSDRSSVMWGPMPGSSSDNSSDLGFLVFVSLVIAILLVIGLRGAT